MNEERIVAYLDLIQQLLSCPSGEEFNQILNNSLELLDEGFVLASQQVAAKLEEAGQENEAGFLRSLAQQVAQFLNRQAGGGEPGETQPNATPEDYATFLIEVLQLKIDGSDRNVIYPFLARHQDKLDPTFGEMLVRWFRSELDPNDSQTNQALAVLLNNLAIDIVEFPLGNRANNLEIAIACYQAALEVYTREAFPENWATTQNNLAVAYFDRIKGERGDNLEIAIACYHFALVVYTREAFPQDWAMTQNNLGNAYWNRIKGERGDNIEGAIACYEAALEVRTREAFPEEWAMTQNNLGAAYWNRIKGEGGDNIEGAIACYEAALEVRTREAFPEDWAGTKNNLAVAYSDRIKGERGDNIERAIACYQAALEVRTREAFPERWAMTQNNLGNAYRNRIKGERGDNIEGAIACYQAALEVLTREAFPENWATTKNNLGNAYRNRIKGERGDNIERAIACYQAALEVRTREAFPQNNAETLFNLGLAYRDASQLENARNTFAEAIDSVEEIRTGIVLGGEADRQKLAEKWSQLYRTMVEVCLELEDSAGALEYAERSKARNLVELFAATRLKPEGVSPDVWEEYNGLYQQWSNLQQQGDGNASPSRPLDRLRQQIDEFIKTKITPHDRKFRFGQQVEPMRYSEIQALAEEGTAIVEWYFTSDGIQAFIVTGQGQQPIVVSTEGSALAALEELTREYLINYYSDEIYWRQELRSCLQRLAEILELDKLISEIPSGCRELVLVPYRYLHLFPLHALPVGENATLGDLFPEGIRYAPSCQILQLSLSEDSIPSATSGDCGENGSLFAIQNPTGDLAYTDVEVEAIETAFYPAATVLQGKTASKTAFYQAEAVLKETGFAHFSCHGYFNFANPRNSCLILADAELAATAPTPPDSLPIRSPWGDFDPEKCLTLPDIFNLRLRRCRLVVLSACQTGVTDITTTSDEYISILAGFFFAGSRNVLGTLWAVDDFSTAIFTIRFYETFLAETQPPVALALKQTQQWMRGVSVAELLEWIGGCGLVGEVGREKICKFLDQWYKPTQIPYALPYYWAGFCAVGQR